MGNGQPGTGPASVSQPNEQEDGLEATVDPAIAVCYGDPRAAAAKSMELIDILPLITVWLQVRVLPGPPAKSMAGQSPV